MPHRKCERGQQQWRGEARCLGEDEAQEQGPQRHRLADLCALVWPNSWYRKKWLALGEVFQILYIGQKLFITHMHRAGIGFRFKGLAAGPPTRA